DLLTPQDDFESVSRILPYVALFNQNADVLLIGGRGVKNAQPRLACAGSYQAALTAPADPTTLVTNQGRFYTRCANFWSNAGVDVTSYNAANIAADVDAMRVALGYDSISLLGIDFGSHVGLEMLRRAADQEPPTIARAALALVHGPDQTMKLPNDIETQLLNLNDAVLADPSLSAVIPDFLDLVSRVLARLDSQPVTVSVTDPETNQVVPITVGAFDLQYVTSRALGTGLQRQLPARYYEMDQGDFSWLGKEALAWRSEIPRNVTPLVATCASGASATRRADVEAQAEFTLLQNAVNGVTFELCNTVGEPDLGDAFRTPVESSVPVLLISGSMDGLTPPSAAEEVLFGLSEGVHVVVEGATHDLFAEAMPKMTPLLLAFLAPPRASTAPAVDASNAVSDTVSSTQLSGLTQTSPLAALLATPISVPFDLEPVRIVPVEALTWRGQYFNNANLQGDPTLVRDDAAINFDWGEGSPSPEISADNFSVRWTTSRELPAGTYRFSVWVDDGARLFVDDVLVIDQWLEGPARNYVTDVNLVRGLHNIRLEYFETEGFALAQLGVSAVNAFPGWQAAYFNNAELQGEPMVVRNENDLNYIWGLQAPVVGVPSENFSARWTRNVSFEANAYRFSVEVAGGVRLWLDGQLLLDDWVSAPVRVRTVDTPLLTAGSHALRVEYNKSSGNGALRVRWAPLTTPVLVPPTAVVTGDTRLLTGQAGSYDGSNSTAAVGGQIVSYTWTFGDGASGVGPIVEHIFTGTGVYNVTLTVTDDKGQSRSSTLQTRVEDQARPPVQEPPVAVIVTSGSGLVGDIMLFDAGRSVASSPLVSFAWDFGDGSTANAVQINKTYSVAGIYNVLLTVTDDQGLSSRTNRLVQIFPAPTPVPTATPTALPTAPPLEPTPTWTPVPPVD
ncbi:MAG: alpha/beta fold hydrolase, partial [Caldilineaceae bacterium]|nr:alpha/beta fold hydrolase [Caldilineaceae bacterium]